MEILNANGLRGNRRLATKRVEPKDTLQFFSFVFSRAYSYNYNLNTMPIIEINSFSEKLDVNTEKGIVVFYKADCSRSNSTVTYLIENKRDFKVVDIEENKENHSFMYEILKDKNEKPKNLLMPVVLIDGSVHYNFEIPLDFQKMFN